MRWLIVLAIVVVVLGLYWFFKPGTSSDDSGYGGGE